MNYRFTSKTLAVMFLISSSVTAFSLFCMGVMFTTGDLPFGMVPVEQQLKVEEEVDPTEAGKVVKKAEEELAEAKGSLADGFMNRINERMVRELYQRLRVMEEKLAEDKAKVADDRRHAEEIKNQAIELQKELEAYRNKVKELLDTIDKKEIENLKRITTLISGLPVEQARAMLKTYDKDKAARVMYYLNPKVARDIVSNILETARDEQDRQDIRDIMDRMHRLTEELDDE